MADFETLRITSHGATLAARHYPGSGEPIVLLHGGPGMGDYFGSFGEMLSPHRVVSYDQRGCGKSSCDGSFEIDEQIADLDAIRRHLGTSRMHLFGHSWGGLLGQLYAKAHPGRVASLVLCCSMANTGKKVAMESRAIAERCIGKQKLSSPAWLAAGLMLLCPGRLGDFGYGYSIKQMLRHYVVRPESVPKAFDASRASKRAWRGTNRAIKAMDDNYLEGMSLASPVLIVQGVQDVIRETNPLLAERFPDARNVRIEHCSHFPWLEQPDVFSKTLLDFYRESARAG
jgi:proline iminopeptidase